MYELDKLTALLDVAQREIDCFTEFRKYFSKNTLKVTSLQTQSISFDSTELYNDLVQLEKTVNQERLK